MPASVPLSKCLWPAAGRRKGDGCEGHGIACLGITTLVLSGALFPFVWSRQVEGQGPDQFLFWNFISLVLDSLGWD